MAELVSVELKDGKREIDLDELYAAYPEAVRMSQGFAPVVPPMKVLAQPTLLSGSYNVQLGPGFVEGDVIKALVSGRTLELQVSTVFCGIAIVKSDVQLGEILVTAKKVQDVKSVDQGQLLLAALHMINKLHEEVDEIRTKNTVLGERMKALEGMPPAEKRAAAKKR